MHNIQVTHANRQGRALAPLLGGGASDRYSQLAVLGQGVSGMRSSTARICALKTEPTAKGHFQNSGDVFVFMH